MFDFIRKPFLWKAWDDGLDKEIGRTASRRSALVDFIRKSFLWKAWDDGSDRGPGRTAYFHLKTIQDLAVYAHLRGSKGQRIAEIGGGASRLLSKLSKNNRCCNVEKFEGSDGGPSTEVKINGVENIKAFLGEFSDKLSPASFDVVFSISVIEHVPNNQLERFFEDGIRILKPGGLWLHAIDLYVEDEPSAAHRNRYEAYRAWMRSPLLEPEGEVFDGELRFTCDMATNPDNTMYFWGSVAPQLVPLRQRAQSVSLILAGRKR